MKLEHIESKLSRAASAMGKKGYARLKKITTAAQRQAWRKKGGAAFRRKCALERKLKYLSEKA